MHALACLRQPCSTAILWALDLETDGLNPTENQILSVGMLPIREGSIILGEAEYHLVQPLYPIHEESLQFHHILPEELKEAQPVQEVLTQVEKHLREGLLLVHYADLDVRFLKTWFQRCGLAWPRPPVVDTAKLLFRYFRRRQMLNQANTSYSLNLRQGRHILGLPDYPEHHALEDALATAELFLALTARMNIRRCWQVLI